MLSKHSEESMETLKKLIDRLNCEEWEEAKVKSDLPIQSFTSSEGYVCIKMEVTIPYSSLKVMKTM